jgi:hypothetical protein
LIQILHGNSTLATDIYTLRRTFRGVADAGRPRTRIERRRLHSRLPRPVTMLN